MLNYIQNLPEAKLWTKFPQWFQAIRTRDAQAMVAMLRSFSTEDGAQVLFFLRALNSLGRQAFMGNDKVYKNPYPSDMLDICRFFYYTESDIRKQWQDLQYRLPIGPIVLELVQVHKPDWFENVYYHHLQGMDIDYPTGIALERIGSPVFPSSSTARALTVFLYSAQRRGWDMQALYCDYPEIFSRDIWTLFSEKTDSLDSEPFPIAAYCQQREQLRKELSSETLSYSEAERKSQEILGPPEYEPYSPLAMVLLDGIAANKLGRERVLRETLLGICRNLGRDQPNGFAYFFTVLQPTPQELLDLQDELIAVLGCTHTKPITTILKYIKTIISHDAFNYEAFIQALPVLLTETASQYIVNYWDAYDKAYRSHHAVALQNIFHTLDEVAEVAFARLRTGDTLPMLSSVTHAPCWIDPLELIARLLLWQKTGRQPHTMDLQLALQRCARENTHAALAAAQALEGEYKALLTYFLEDKPSLPSRRTHPAWWVTAALMRPERCVPQELLTPGFTNIPPEYFGTPFQWNITQKKHCPYPEGELIRTSEQYMRIALPRPKSAPIYYYYATKVEKIPATGKWDELFCGRMFLAEDVLWLNQALALYPNNPEPLTMDFIAAYGDEEYPKVLRFLEKLLELRVPMGPASHLLLALSFVAGVKEPRLYAAAFWRTKVEEGHIDCAELGRLLGQLEAHKWVPAKRFTDVVDKELLTVSPLHSAQLAIMLEAMLLEIGPEPQVAIKRILELYYELTAAQGKKLPAPMLPLLNAWGTEKSQAAIIKKLRTLG